MKTVFTSHDSAELGFLKSVLEDAGIECLIRNETQAYQTVFQPELWVLQDEDASRAEELCKAWRRPFAAEQQQWTCGGCGEQLEAQFDTCWNCGTHRGIAILPESSIREPDPRPVQIDSGNFPGGWKPFQAWMVLALAFLAAGVELYWKSGLLGHPMTSLYHPVNTALWYAGQYLLLEDGWKNVAGPRKWLWKWHMVSEKDPDRFSEQVLRDTLEYAQRNRFPGSNIVQLRANLTVLLAENSLRETFAKELQLLSSEPAATNFVLAARAVYETNRTVPLDATGDPLEAMGSTSILDKFEARWLAIQGKDSEAERVRASLKSAAAELQQKHFVLLNTTMLMQALGLCALAWLVVDQNRFRGWRRKLVVPWTGWEGLGVLCAAWLLGILLQDMLNRAFGTYAFTYFAYSGLMYTPLLLLLWFRHWHQDRTSFSNLFGLTPLRNRGGPLMLAGLGVFVVSWMAFDWVHGAARAAGIDVHWAEGFYEPEYYEPWRLRWIILSNAVLFGPIGEEIMFRGILFPALRNWMPMSGAAVLSAILFALPHYYGWAGFLALVAFGFVNALAAHFTGSLVPCIIGHVLTNLFLVAGYSWVFGG